MCFFPCQCVSHLSAPLPLLSKGTSRAIFHNQEKVPLFLKVMVESNHVGARKGRKEIHFSDEILFSGAFIEFETLERNIMLAQ